MFCSHPNLRFIYQDPRAGFDRSAVKGLVAKLIKVKEMRDALAVEIAAGGSVRSFRSLITHLHFNISVLIAPSLRGETIARIQMKRVGIMIKQLNGRRGNEKYNV